MVVLMCGMPILVSKNFLETYGRFHKANRYTSQTLRQGFVAMQNLCSSIFVQVTRLLYTTNWATPIIQRPLPKHLLPTSSQPSWHSHLNEPSVFTQTFSQPPLFVRHSLMSLQAVQNKNKNQQQKERLLFLLNFLFYCRLSSKCCPAIARSLCSMSFTYNFLCLNF